MQLARKWLVATALLAVSTVGRAATAPLMGIAHVALRVGDLAAAQAFYEKLGFVRAFELSRNGVVYEKYMKVNDRQFIELYATSDKEPDASFLHLCFEGGDLNAIHDGYVSLGLTPITVRKAGAGNLLFTLAGPMQPEFAQNIEYAQYLPGSLHSADFGKHLGAERVADRIVSVTLAMRDPAAARTFYVEKLGFAQGTGGLLALPGAPKESVEIVGPELGRKARFTLTTGNLEEAARLLKEHGVAFVSSAQALTVTDPDGNVVLIRHMAPPPL